MKSRRRVIEMLASARECCNGCGGDSDNPNITLGMHCTFPRTKNDIADAAKAFQEAIDHLNALESEEEAGKIYTKNVRLLDAVPDLLTALTGHLLWLREHHPKAYENSKQAKLALAKAGVEII